MKEILKTLKSGAKPKKNLGIESKTIDIKQKILDSDYTKSTKNNLIKLYTDIGTEVFGNSKVVDVLGCSEATATSYIKRMFSELRITVQVEGNGKGKYRFNI